MSLIQFAIYGGCPNRQLKKLRVQVAEEAEEVEVGESGLKPAPRIESGCHLDRAVLLASLSEIESYLQQSDADEKKTDESYISRLSDMVHVLGADMNNLRAYCERAQTQLESIRSPIKELTDKIFRTISAADEEELRESNLYHHNVM